MFAINYYLFYFNYLNLLFFTKNDIFHIILFMKIAFIPIDNRPVCYNLAVDIAAIDKSIEFFIPPREYLGSLTKYADTDKIYEWFNSLPDVDKVIISLDTIAYGGLIPSRRSNDSENMIKERVQKFRSAWTKKKAKVLAFSSIMRISNNNYNEEEKEYWKDYGTKIFEYSYNTHKCSLGEFGSPIQNLIPKSILNDYLMTRQRNFNINKMYLEWQKLGFFDELIFSKDDCAEYGFNVKEAKELQNAGGKVITGADEIPISLLSRAVEKDISVKPVFIENDSKNLISNYEDVSIEQSVLNQLNLAGIRVQNDADITLIVNNFKEHQGEIVMKRPTEQFSGEIKLPDTPYMIADVRNANGADNNFVAKILPQINLSNFYGYSAWNTSANSLGTLICAAKIKFNAKEYDDNAFKKVQMIRFLDDWAYQANIRQTLDKPQDIKDKMKPYEEKISEILNIQIKNNYIYPWNRLFEVEVVDESC